MRQPERPDDADNPLRLCYTGPSPTEQRQLEIERRFGLRIMCGYAMSETPYGTVWARGTRPYGTLGSIRQHPTLGEVNEGRVMRDGRQVAAGEVGELSCATRPSCGATGVCPRRRAGSCSRTAGCGPATSCATTATARYTFVGREKEVIRRRGENVAPAEIEEVLMSHPDVLEAAVVGVPSELSEEEIKAFVVVRDAASSELPAIRAWAAERLTRFKVPRYLEAVAELPHTPTGRVAKHRLERDRTADEIDFEADGR